MEASVYLKGVVLPVGVLEGRMMISSVVFGQMLLY